MQCNNGDQCEKEQAQRFCQQCNKSLLIQVLPDPAYDTEDETRDVPGNISLDNPGEEYDRKNNQVTFNRITEPYPVEKIIHEMSSI